MDTNTTRLIEAIIVGLPAIIAAISSLKNGVASDRHDLKSDVRAERLRADVVRELRNPNNGSSHPQVMPIVPVVPVETRPDSVP